VKRSAIYLGEFIFIYLLKVFELVFRFLKTFIQTLFVLVVEDEPQFNIHNEQNTNHISFLSFFLFSIYLRYDLFFLLFFLFSFCYAISVNLISFLRN
jgi:hypothetical protein